MTSHAQHSTPPAAPLLTWVGGKRQLLPVISAGAPAAYTRYIEPFVGGGAVFFSLTDGGRRSTIADINPELTNLYTMVRDRPDDLRAAVEALKHRLGEAAYYAMRASSPSCPVARAARVIYLNHLCFNGLWRENQQGQMNSPWGGPGRNLNRVDDRIVAAHQRLRGTRIIAGGFDTSLKYLRRGAWVYSDPPYIPAKLGYFTQYSRTGFVAADHERLADRIGDLATRGIHVMLSNSDCPEVARIYGPHMTLYRVPARRSIGASATSRRGTTEIIGVTYPVEEMFDGGEFRRRATAL